MGFLDNVKKGLDSAASQLNQAATKGAQQGGSVPGPAGSPPPPPGSAGYDAHDTPPPPEPVDTNLYGDDDFIDGFHPETWLDPDVVSKEDLIGMELPCTLDFSELQVFETDDSYTARYVDSTNGFTLDLASIKEERLGELGTQEGVATHYAGQLAESSRYEIGDVSIVGSNGPGHLEIVVCIGDLVAKQDLYGPAWLDLDQARQNCHELMLAALRLY